MNRRAIIRRLAAIAGGAALAPACSRFSAREVLAAYDNLNITEEEDERIRTLCEIIIPGGDGVKGANDLMIEDFVMVMVNDCLDEEQQQTFQNGLRALTPYCQKKWRKDPDALTKPEWEEMILSLLQTDDDASLQNDGERRSARDAKSFLNTVKKYTIQGFVTSEYYMTEIMPYAMFPGKFQGKVLITPDDKINLYG